jgi:hypothetical protein
MSNIYTLLIRRIRDGFSFFVRLGIQRIRLSLGRTKTRLWRKMSLFRILTHSLAFSTVRILDYFSWNENSSYIYVQGSQIEYDSMIEKFARENNEVILACDFSLLSNWHAAVLKNEFPLKPLYPSSCPFNELNLNLIYLNACGWTCQFTYSVWIDRIV